MTISKISTANVNSLIVGDIVVKYPIFGAPVPNFNRDDLENLSVFQISSADEQYLRLQLPAVSGTVAGLGISIGPLHKKRDELAEDGRWWKVTNDHEDISTSECGYL